LKLQKRIRFIELRAAIDALRNDGFAPAEELEMRAQKVAELEKLCPTPPPYPRTANDLSVTRESLVDDIERYKRKAEPILAQLERETDEGRIALLKFQSDQYARYANAVDRLERWEMLRVWKLWDAERREQLQAEEVQSAE